MAGRRQLGTPRKRGDGEKSLRLVILILSSHGDPGCERLIHGGGRRAGGGGGSFVDVGASAAARGHGTAAAVRFVSSRPVFRIYSLA